MGYFLISYHTVHYFRCTRFTAPMRSHYRNGHLFIIYSVSRILSGKWYNKKSKISPKQYSSEILGPDFLYIQSKVSTILQA